MQNILKCKNVDFGKREEKKHLKSLEGFGLKIQLNNAEDKEFIKDFRS